MADEKRGPGRPPVLSEDALLSAALRAFATYGYEGASIRTLSRELGVSHNTLNSRFGNKDKLWKAAVDHGFGTLRDALMTRLRALPLDANNRTRLRETIRGFLHAFRERPELLQITNHEGLEESDRLDYLFREFIEPAISLALALGGMTNDESASVRAYTRTLYFLIAHGGGAPLALNALSARFDIFAGPLDIDAHIDAVAELLSLGMPAGLD